MKTKYSIVFLIALVLLTGCTQQPEITEQNNSINIVTSLFPYAEFARAVGKDKVVVTQLLPPGTSPHTFDPKPSDVKTLVTAEVFIYNGAGLEPWVEDLIKGASNNKLRIIDASKLVDLEKHEEETHDDDDHHEDEEDDHGHEEETHDDDDHHEDEEDDHGHEEEAHDDDDHHHHGELDPHLWTSFHNDEKIVDVIASTLSEIDPANAVFYKENAATYKAELESLEAKYKNDLSNCKHRSFITGGHSAFGYLAEDYNLEQIAVQGLSPDAEPSSAKIAQIVELVKTKEIKYIYFEKTVNPKTAEVIASETGAKTLMLDPVPVLKKDEIGKETFLSVMNTNLNNLKIGLECS